ncbi:MAG: GTP 3',8-cyclase MoaA [Planctomycetaceae bacterium]|nr:GTP 3',8-cyclase MoaA [Planctomycetaceae bacterium]
MQHSRSETRRLTDRFGRVHNSLRVSVTDRCNIRCFYCMPEDNVTFLPKSELLTFEELERVVRVGVSLGIDRVRITGGEPLVRRQLPRLITALTAIAGVRDVGLTTNGILLAEQAQVLREAGLSRINISLDALTPEIFRRVTRRDGFEKVMEGITAAQTTGFDVIKLNAVSVRGLTEDQIVPFGHFARNTGITVRFIEFMPLDADCRWQRDKVLFAHEILEILQTEFGPLVPVSESNGQAPAEEFAFSDGQGRIGLIASVSRPFCAACNRFRLTAEGKLRNCLFSLEETDVRSLLRNGGTDEQIADAMVACVAAKNEGHEINTARFVQPGRPMYSIGG